MCCRGHSGPLAELLPYPCRHRAHGCDAEIPPSELEDHCKSCLLNPDLKSCMMSLVARPLRTRSFEAVYISLCQGTLDSASFAVAPHEQATISYGRVLPLRPCSLGSDAATWYALMPLAWCALMPLAVALGRQAFCGGATLSDQVMTLLSRPKTCPHARCARAGARGAHGTWLPAHGCIYDRGSRGARVIEPHRLLWRPRQAFCGGAAAERRARRLLGQKKPMLDSRIQSSRQRGGQRDILLRRLQHDVVRAMPRHDAMVTTIGPAHRLAGQSYGRL